MRKITVAETKTFRAKARKLLSEDETTAIIDTISANPEIAKALRQVPPPDACPIALNDRLNQQPVVSGAHPDIRGRAPQKLFDPLPLVIAKAIATHLVATPYKKLIPNEPLKGRFGNPLFHDTA